jgi:L-serine dehydratase
MNIFDILGPVMVGPSSSHTAGAVRIGMISRQLLGKTPKRAEIVLHGSFAATGSGHGTDRAIVAGLLGMEPDDPRIPSSYQVAEQEGMEFTMESREIRGAHPNTAALHLYAEDGTEATVQASSIGGGRICVNQLDGIEVNFSGEHNTLIVHHVDRLGLLAEVTSLMSFGKVNIAALQLFREKRGGTAVMVAEIDNPLPVDVLRMVESLSGVLKATYINVKG